MGRGAIQVYRPEMPLEVLCTRDTTKLCHWLYMFVKKARRDNRQLYTPHSLTQLPYSLDQTPLSISRLS